MTGDGIKVVISCELERKCAEHFQIKIHHNQLELNHNFASKLKLISLIST